MTLHYNTLHYTTLHYITLHYITLHCITLRYTTLHYIYITLHLHLHYKIYYLYFQFWGGSKNAKQNKEKTEKIVEKTGATMGRPPLEMPMPTNLSLNPMLREE